MNVPNASAPWWCLAIAVLLTLPSCASWTTRGSGLTPRSEAICDQAPPSPIPPQPRTDPEHAAWVAILLGLYEWEVDKSVIERECRQAVREANASAFERAR